MDSGTTAWLAVGAFAFLVLVNAAAWGHGGVLQEKAPPDFVPGPPVSGMNGFIRTLVSQFVPTFTPDQLEVIAFAARVEEQADRDAAAATDDAGRAEAARLRAWGQRQLLHMLEEHPLTTVLIAGSGTQPVVRASLGSTSGLAFVRLESGQGPVDMRSLTLDLADQRSVAQPPMFSHQSTGTTWYVVELLNAPSGKTVQQIRVTPDGDPQSGVAGMLLLEAPRLGSVKLRFIDEHGEETPVLVRLTSAMGIAHPPAAFIDFRNQMDNPAHWLAPPTAAHGLNVPGPFSGLYWCVNGPVDMGLAEGEWQVHIRHGLEYAPVHDQISVRSGETTERTYQLERWTDMAARGWFAGDDHVHSRLIDSTDAERLMAWVRAEGIHVANVLHMGDQFRTHFEQRGFGPAFRVQQGLHVLVPGQEDPRYAMGHAIGLNIAAPARDLSGYLLNDRVADQVRAGGGLYGFAHLATRLFDVHRDMTMLMPRAKADFGEILQFNSLGTDLYYDFLDLGFRLAASAGSDVPYGSSLGEVRLYAYLGDQPFSADAWFAAMRQGRTFVTNGPMLELQVEDAMPGDELRVTDDRPLRVHARAVGLPGASSPVSLRVVVHSTVAREVHTDDADSGALETEFVQHAGYGCWVAAEARGADGSVAHTTPVYVVRDGYRFWNVERAGVLLRERLANLDEIERVVADLAAQPATPGSEEGYGVNIAAQVDAVRASVAEVRGLYEGLVRELESELVVRGGAGPSPTSEPEEQPDLEDL